MLMAAARAIMRSSSCSGRTTSCTCRVPLSSCVFEQLLKLNKGFLQVVSCLESISLSVWLWLGISMTAPGTATQTMISRRNNILPGMASVQSQDVWACMENTSIRHHSIQGAHQLVASLRGHHLDIRAHLCQRCDGRGWPRLVRVRSCYCVGHLHLNMNLCDGLPLKSQAMRDHDHADRATDSLQVIERD